MEVLSEVGTPRLNQEKEEAEEDEGKAEGGKGMMRRDVKEGQERTVVCETVPSKEKILKLCGREGT